MIDNSRVGNTVKLVPNVEGKPLGLQCRGAFPKNIGTCCEGKCCTRMDMNMC